MANMMLTMYSFDSQGKVIRAIQAFFESDFPKKFVFQEKV